MVVIVDKTKKKSTAKKCWFFFDVIIGWWSFSLHPLTSWMRFWFFFLTLTNLHVELPLYWQALGFPEKRKHSYFNGYATSHQLEDNFETWCALPKPFLAMGDGGLRSPMFELITSITGHHQNCIQVWHIISMITSLCLFLAAIGFLGRLSPLVAAVGLFMQDGCFQMVRDSNHRMLLPSMCCLWIALNDYGQHGAWSVDKVVANFVGKRFWPCGNKSPFRKTHFDHGQDNGNARLRSKHSEQRAILSPIAASRMFCAMTMATVFTSAGFSKLTIGRNTLDQLSFSWADGNSLRSKLQGGNPGGVDAQTLPLLLKPLLRENGLIPFLASATLFTELLSGTALCNIWARRLISITLAGFHVGVLLTMYNVNYIPSAISYLTLLVDWQGEDSKFAEAKRRGKLYLSRDDFGFGVAAALLLFPVFHATFMLGVYIFASSGPLYFAPAALWLNEFGFSREKDHFAVICFIFELLLGITGVFVLYMKFGENKSKYKSDNVKAMVKNRLTVEKSEFASLYHQRPLSHYVHSTIIAVVGYSFLAYSIKTAVFHEENWPVSSIPMFSQYRNQSFKQMCIQESQLPLVSLERHNKIMTPNSWFETHAVLWDPDRGIVMQPLKMTAKVTPTSAFDPITSSLRGQIMMHDPQLSLFGGSRDIRDVALQAASTVLPLEGIRFLEYMDVLNKGQKDIEQQVTNGKLDIFHRRRCPSSMSSKELHAQMTSLAALQRSQKGVLDPQNPFKFRMTATHQTFSDNPTEDNVATCTNNDDNDKHELAANTSSLEGGLNIGRAAHRALAVFLESISMWLAPPLLYLAAPNGPCHKFPHDTTSSTRSTSTLPSTGYPASKEFASTSNHFSSLCESLTNEDRQLQSRMKFVGYQSIAWICLDKYDDVQIPTNQTNVTSDSASRKIPFIIGTAMPNKHGKFSDAPPCLELDVTQSSSLSSLSASSSSNVEKLVPNWLWLHWNYNGSVLREWCDILLNPHRLMILLNSNKEEYQKKRGKKMKRSEMMPCSQIDGNSVEKGLYAAMTRKRGTCHDFCASQNDECIRACDTRGSCNCDERPMKPEHCNRRWGSKVCVCKHSNL